MTFPPQYLFYGIVLLLICVILRFVFWWWHDAVITTTAMQIAREKLRSIGIYETLSPTPEQILETLQGAIIEDSTARDLILASLYLLRSEFHLGYSFFMLLSQIPGFELSADVPEPPAMFDEVRGFVFNNDTILPPNKPKLVDEAADRLHDNLLELEESENRRQRAAA